MELDVETIAQSAAVGNVFRCLAGLDWTCSQGTANWYPVDDFRVYSQWLGTAMQMAGWGPRGEGSSGEMTAAAARRGGGAAAADMSAGSLRRAVRSVVARERLKDDVHRLRVEVDGAERSLIVKWSDPVVAHRSRLLAQRWLPAAGLEDCGPPLVAVVAERTGDGAWQVYDDLPGRPLSTDRPVEGEVEAAMEAIARVHTAFAEHALLPEFRLLGGDRGWGFYSANVRDAIVALRSLDLDRADRMRSRPGMRCSSG